MASKKVNIANTDNKVTVTNSNNKIKVIDTNVPSAIEITQPVTTIIEINSAGPQGAVGSQGIQGIPGSTIFTSIDSSLYATTSSLQLTGSLDIAGNLTVNGKSVFIQTSSLESSSAIEVQGRIKVIESQIGNYIASASIQIGNTIDTIDCGGFF